MFFSRIPLWPQVQKVDAQRVKGAIASQAVSGRDVLYESRIIVDFSESGQLLTQTRSLKKGKLMSPDRPNSEASCDMAKRPRKHPQRDPTQP